LDSPDDVTNLRQRHLLQLTIVREGNFDLRHAFYRSIQIVESLLIKPAGDFGTHTIGAPSFFDDDRTVRALQRFDSGSQI